MSRPFGTKNIKTPEELWKHFEDYKAQLEVIQVPVTHPKEGVVFLPIPEPMTMEGFSSFLSDQEIIEQLDDYVKDKDGRYVDYTPIIARVKKDIFKHNFSRAAAGMYKENLIARQLGMVEKSDNKTEHSGGIEIKSTITIIRPDESKP